MDRADAMEELAVAYRRALEAEADGRTPAEIAEELGLDGSAIGPFLQIARAKLERLLGSEASAAQ